jgi:LmbE family N-acetylglucosaminyl deacetylase
MNEYNFTLVLAADAGMEDGTAIEVLGEHGVTDATVARADGTWTAEFDREAASFPEALTSAVRAVRTAGLIVRRVEPDDLVTMSELADRLGRSIESVRLLTSGRRGDGSFPTPVVRTTSRGHLWSWAQVARWDRRPAEELERADWIAGINARIQLNLFDSEAERAMLAELTEALA